MLDTVKEDKNLWLDRSLALEKPTTTIFITAHGTKSTPNDSLQYISQFRNFLQ